MKFLFSLAFKNLTRYKKRTVITTLAIIFGMALYILIDSMLIGFEKESERNLFWYETSMARVQHIDYKKEEKILPLIYRIKNSDKIIAILNEQNISSTPRIDFKGEAIVYQNPYPEDGSLPIHCIGVDIEKDKNIYRLQDTIIEGKGRYLVKGDVGIVIGSKLAKNLGAEVGYPFLIRTRTKNGTIQTIDTEIIGIIKTPNPPLNSSAVFMTLEMADEYLEMEGEVTSISMNFSESLDVEKESQRIEDLIKNKLGDVAAMTEVINWKILAADFVAIATAKKGASSIMILLVMIIAGIGISNTMLMATYERISELSMMRSMGMSDNKIKFSFLLEAAGIGLLGTTGALALGIFINYFFVKNGLDWTSMFDMDFSDMDIGYRTTGFVYGVWNIKTYIITVITGILLPIIVAYLPANRSTKMNIIDGLRQGGTR